MEARWATVGDVDELVRLREVMMEAEPVVADDAWRVVVAHQLAVGLESGYYFAAIVDGPGGGLVGSGVGMVWERLAWPGDDGRLGYIQSMATDPAWRSKGVARAVMTLLMAGFTERGVRRVALHATPAGEPLYRSLDFVEPRHPELRWYA